MSDRTTRRGAEPPAWAPRLEPHSGRPGARPAGLALFLLCASISYVLFGGGVDQVGPEPAEPAAPALAEQPPIAVRAAAERSGSESDSGDVLTLTVVTGRIRQGGSLSSALQEQGADVELVYGIADALAPVFSFQNARAGDFFALIQDNRGGLVSFEFQRGRRDVYRLDRKADGSFRPLHEQIPLDRRVVQLAGIIDRSLFDTILVQGEGRALVHQFADIFVWDFDFSRQTRPGDEVRLVYEKFYDRAGFVRYGNILAAQYRTSQREFTAFYYGGENGEGDYYTPQGNSVRRTFLRAPLRFSRISSRYSNSRLHPILKVRRSHKGIDYAAPRGTAIWAVADGEVTYRGWSQGFGRLVKIRHNNGYVTYYGHLSRYGKGIRAGVQVSQKDVIGFVGTSGLATGPHLDYRLKVGGRFVDPSKVRFPKGAPIPLYERPRFDELKQVRLAELRSVSPPLVLEAAM